MSTERTWFQSPIVRQLMWLSVVVLIIPWLGFESLLTMKRFMVEGQQQTQLQLASGVASLLNRDRALLEGMPQGDFAAPVLPVFPVTSNQLIDGYEDEWHQLSPFSQHFNDEKPTFSLLMAQDGQYLFGLVKIEDDTLAVRRPGNSSLTSSDYVRLFCHDKEGKPLYLALTFEGNGPARVYRARPGWKKLASLEFESRIRAEIITRPNGYDVEFRLPLALLGSEKTFGLAVVDAPLSSHTRPAHIAGTYERLNDGILNPVSLRSRELERQLSVFAGEGTRLWLIDRHRQVRALVGQLQINGADELDVGPWWQQLFERFTGALVGVTYGSFDDFDANTIHRRNDDIYSKTLSGGQAQVAVRRSLDDRVDIITAAVPLGESADPVGVLLLEKSNQSILQLQRQSLQTLLFLTLLAMGLVALILLLFALRLAIRIRRLGTDSSGSVDQYGRLKSGAFIRGGTKKDEIGDVARLFNAMLLRMQNHQQFLNNIPRILRHEINNPLNTIGTSVDRLADLPGSDAYVASAKRGLARIGHVVSAITEGASLEQALQEGDKERLDLSQLVDMYFQHQMAATGCVVALEIKQKPIWVMGSGEYLETLLDKLFDNARQYAACYQGADEPVKIMLVIEKDAVVLNVVNRGPLIDEASLPRIFDLMYSQRQPEGDHMGLGLYVARLIVEFHGGKISAHNLGDGTGVCFTVTLPLAV